MTTMIMSGRMRATSIGNNAVNMITAVKSS
jgi:hypothetical protein